MLLRERKLDFCLKMDILRITHVWVRLPQLPLYLWEDRSLSKIESDLGNPLLTDECTTNKLKVSYARILLEIDITKKLSETININDSEGRKIPTHVEF